MQANHLISVSDFCVYHSIEFSFVQLLEQQGLVETITVERAVYIEPDQLGRLEKFVRLHQDLAIHPEDLDVVNELLERVEALQNQIVQLQNQLLFYER